MCGFSGDCNPGKLTHICQYLTRIASYLCQNNRKMHRLLLGEQRSIDFFSLFTYRIKKIEKWLQEYESKQKFILNFFLRIVDFLPIFSSFSVQVGKTYWEVSPPNQQYLKPKVSKNVGPITTSIRYFFHYFQRIIFQLFIKRIIQNHVAPILPSNGNAFPCRSASHFSKY